MFQVTQIVRFLLERGLRFRNNGVCGRDLIKTHSQAERRPASAMHLYRSTRRLAGGLAAFIPPFLEGHGAFACDQDLQVAPTVRIRDLNRRFSGLQIQVSPGLRFTCCLTIPTRRRQLRGVMSR